MNSYKDLIVWQKSMDLVVLTYAWTDGFSKSELYGLVSQLRRAAVSIPSNIAEGRRRGTDPQFQQFLQVAYGSGAELETRVEIAKRVSFGDIEKRIAVEKLLDEVMKMLNSLVH